MLRSTTSAATPGMNAIRPSLYKPRRRQRTHSVLFKPSVRGITSTAPSATSTMGRMRPATGSNLPSSQSSTFKSSSSLAHSRHSMRPSTAAPFSTSAVLERRPINRGLAKDEHEASRMDGETIYRKIGSKIVPVQNAMDQVEMPVSGLFSQFEDLSKPSAVDPKPTSVEQASSQDLDIGSLTLQDVLPPDQLLEQLLKQNGYKITVEETKALVQSLLDVLTLPAEDPERVKVEKDIAAVCKKKQVAAERLAGWLLQYTRDGAPLSFALFKVAQDGGDIYARYSYATMLYRGARGVPADPAKGKAILKVLSTPSKPQGRVTFKGFPWAQTALAGIYAREEQNYEAARDLYIMAAEKGVPEAKIALGRMYLNGELPQDFAKAKKYFLSASSKDEDYAEANFLLGSMESRGEKPNQKLAFQYFQKAASKGLPEAQYNVGLAYFRGLGVPKNEAMAVEYWKMSGQQGFGLSQLSLGAYYFQDEDEEKELEAARVQQAQKQQQEAGGTTAVVSDTIAKPKHVWDPSKKDLMQAQKWFTLASRRPGHLGEEGKRLKAKVEQAIRQGGGASRDNRMCTIM